MKTWMAKNKGVTIVVAMIITALEAVMVAGPNLLSAFFRAHGF
jgi:hypothetical protein